MSYIDPILSRDGMESIQAVLCCAAYSLRSSVGTSHWKLAGLTVRQCVELGYHRSGGQVSTRLDPIRLEMKKRVMWSAYSMECAACIHLGRPLCLHSHDIDAELPTDIDDLYVTSTGIDGESRTHRSDAATSVTRAIASIKLRALQGRIHAELYSDTRLAQVSRTDQRKRIATLHKELDAWRKSLPEQFQSVWRPLSLFMTSEWSLIVYNSAILQLYRTQLTETRGADTDTEIARICITSATIVCNAFRRQFFGKPTTFTWGALHEIFLAAFTYIYCLWTCDSVRKALTLQEISNTCNDCTITFVILAERWSGAAPYRDLFEALKFKTLEMLSKEVKNSDSLQTGGTPSKSRVSVDLSDLELLPDWVATVGGGLRGSLPMDQLLDEIIDNRAS